MNEITRIHIAKVAYDVEVTAKKQLEKYIKSLESYTQDADVLSDIEIRMTELLAERGVTAGKVISSDDVAAIRTQLGEPYEFADNDGGDFVTGSTPSEGARRLYRNTDQAVLGGVLSGIASYFGVNPVWTRIIFIALTFVSFGFALFAYIVLWVIIPPARTAAERLQLTGKPVTVASIRELNETDESSQPNRVAPTIQRILSMTLGVVAALAALGTFIATISGTVWALAYGGIASISEHSFTGVDGSYIWLAWLTFWIVVAGGLLLTALFGLIAYAFFARKMTKRMIMSGVIIIVLGVASAATSVGIVATQSWRISSEAQSAVRETKANLSPNFQQVRTVSFEAAGSYNEQYSYTSVRYVVDNGAPRYELQGLPGVKPKVTIDGTSAKISLITPKDTRNMYVQPQLTIYGPALTAFVANNTTVNYEATSQDAVTVTATESSRTTVSGTFNAVTVNGTGPVDVSSSSIVALTVVADHRLEVIAGTVRDLTVTQPDVCPRDISQYGYDATSVTVSGVTSDAVTYNGEKRPAETYRTSCASLLFESIEDREDMFYDN